MAAKDKTPKEIAAGDGIASREVPADLGDYSGEYTYLPTGEKFALKILPDSEVRAHKTHTAKNALKFWDGTAAEFRELFDKA